MTIISLDQVRANPEEFLAKIEAGESIVLMRGSIKVAEIRPEASTSPGVSRPFGFAKGEITISEDFDAPLPDDMVGDFEAA